MAEELWKKTAIGENQFFLMNLDHPFVEARVIAEMESGVDVYYDRRWGATGILTQWMAQNLPYFQEKRVLALGAGVGAETLILGKYAEHIWINDLAPAALELCAEQMEKNDLANFTNLLGRYEDLALPEVDLVVGGFLIYNDDTLAAMEAFLASHAGDVILVNERLAPFPKFLKEHEHEIIFDIDGAVGVLLSKSPRQ